MNGAVEDFHARGRAAVLAGEEIYDQPPGTSSPRWGVSVILRPDIAVAEPLAGSAALVGWVEARRRLDLGVFHARCLDLVRHEYNGACTAPVALTSVPLES